MQDKQDISDVYGQLIIAWENRTEFYRVYDSISSIINDIESKHGFTDNKAISDIWERLTNILNKREPFYRAFGKLKTLIRELAEEHGFEKPVKFRSYQVTSC